MIDIRLHLIRAPTVFQPVHTGTQILPDLFVKAVEIIVKTGSDRNLNAGIFPASIM